MAYLCGDHGSERVWALAPEQAVAPAPAGQRLNAFAHGAGREVYLIWEFVSVTMLDPV